MIDFGLDLLHQDHRSGSGNGGFQYSTALAAAKEPFANFRASRAGYEQLGTTTIELENKYTSEI